MRGLFLLVSFAVLLLSDEVDDEALFASDIFETSVEFDTFDTADIIIVF